MENLKYKIGDRIRVFEVLQDGQDYWAECGNILGKQVCETLPNSEYGCPDVFIETPLKTKINLAPNLFQSKHVATIVITKLK